MTDIRIPEPIVTPVRFEVSCLPVDHPDRRYFVIWVEASTTEPGKYLVREPYEPMLRLANADGTWSDRAGTESKSWWEQHRFPMDIAVRAAKLAAPHLTCTGFDVAFMLLPEDEQAAVIKARREAYGRG